ncbi:MAG: putative ABC transport system permease protein, partial [Gammaproteobacteria bacterium]
ALWDQYFAGTELSQAYLLAQFDTGKVKHKVVGVVNDIYNEGADTPVQPTVYNVISALTGFETIIIKTHAPITQVESELQTAVRALSVNFNDLSLTPLSSLVKNEQAPRNALLIITVVCSSILLLSAFLYNYSSIKQLTAKSSTELALRRAMGARSYQICYLFLKLFFTAFVITHIVIIALFFTQHEKLQTFLFQQSVFDLNTILTVHLVILLAVICIIAIEIKKTLNNSWNNLT